MIVALWIPASFHNLLEDAFHIDGNLALAQFLGRLINLCRIVQAIPQDICIVCVHQHNIAEVHYNNSVFTYNWPPFDGRAHA